VKSALWKSVFGSVGLAFVLFTATPSLAQTQQTSGLDISGVWVSAGNQGDSMAQVQLVDYAGVQLSEAGRIYSLTWNPSRMTGRQQQCAGYDPQHIMHGGGNHRFWEERDPFTQKLIAIKIYGQITEGTRTIWMDGRPHPPAYAPHTFLGFSTGKYEGGVLSVETTHLKRNWIRSNGIAFSSEATMVEHFIRHGDYLTLVSIIDDPTYLEEPFIRTSQWMRTSNLTVDERFVFDISDEVVGHPPGYVPHYALGNREDEFAAKQGLPFEATQGGKETTYPEYELKLRQMIKEMPKPPAKQSAQNSGKGVAKQGPQ